MLNMIINQVAEDLIRKWRQRELFQFCRYGQVNQRFYLDLRVLRKNQLDFVLENALVVMEEKDVAVH